MTKANNIEWSHGRARQAVRVDAVTPVESDESRALHVPATDANGEVIRTKKGKIRQAFAPGNQAWRLAQLERRSEGIATMDPAKVPTWMRPHVELGRPYVTALLAMLESKPVLWSLAGDVADAHVLYRAHVALAVAAEETKERNDLMQEARAWLREHRTALATLRALAGDLHVPSPNDAGLAPPTQAEIDAEDEHAD